jgi:O-antigen ligase
VIFFNPFFKLFTSHNANAGFLGSILILNILFLVNKDLIKAFKINGLLLIISSLYISFWFLLFYSRAFFAGLIVAIFILIWLDLRNRKKLSLKRMFIAASLFTLIVGLSLFTPLADRILKLIENPYSDFNFFMRVKLWSLALELWLQDLKTILFGIGIGKFNDYSIVEVYKKFNTGFYFGEGHAHNIVLQLLVEQGVVGLITLFVIFLFLLRRLGGLYKRFKHFIIVKPYIKFAFYSSYSLFIYLFVASMFGLNFFTPSTSIIFYILLANNLAFAVFLQKLLKYKKNDF